MRLPLLLISLLVVPGALITAEPTFALGVSADQGQVVLQIWVIDADDGRPIYLESSEDLYVWTNTGQILRPSGEPSTFFTEIRLPAELPIPQYFRLSNDQRDAARFANPEEGR